MKTFGEGNGNPLQYSCLENPMDGGAWQTAVHGVGKSLTRQRFHFHFPVSCIGEGNGNHSSVPAWRIPGREQPGRLPSMGSHRVRHDWSDLAAAAAAWRLWNNTVTRSNLKIICYVVFASLLFPLAPHNICIKTKVWKMYQKMAPAVNILRFISLSSLRLSKHG